MASREVIAQKLSEPFPPSAIKTHPERRNLSYVEGHTYINKLIDATNNRYDWRVISITSVPFGATQKGAPKTLVTLTGELTIEGFGTRAGVGVQVVVDGGGEDMLKGANTDAIKAAAKLFGVGLALYGPDYVSGEIASIPEAAPQSPTIDEKGRKALEAKRTEHGLSHDDMRDLAMMRYGVKSSKDLTIDQGRDLWQYIGTLPKPAPELSDDDKRFLAANPPQQAGS